MIFVTRNKEIVEAQSYKIWKDSRSQSIWIRVYPDNTKRISSLDNKIHQELNSANEICLYHVESGESETELDICYDLLLKKLTESSSNPYPHPTQRNDVIDLSQLQQSVHPNPTLSSSPSDSPSILSYSDKLKLQQYVKSNLIKSELYLILHGVPEKELELLRLELAEVAKYYFEPNYHAAERNEKGEWDLTGQETPLWNFSIQCIQTLFAQCPISSKSAQTYVLSELERWINYWQRQKAKYFLSKSDSHPSQSQYSWQNISIADMMRFLNFAK